MSLQLVTAWLVAWLLVGVTGAGYWGRVEYAVLIGIAAGVACHLPYWNWWSFSAGHTIVNMLDLVIGLFLAGMVIARFVG